MGSIQNMSDEEPPAYGEPLRGTLTRLPHHDGQIGPYASTLLTMRCIPDDGESKVSLKLTTFIHINNTTSFESVQRQVRQRYLESAWNTTRSSFTWELWMLYSDGISKFVDEESWPDAQLGLLTHSYRTDQADGLLAATYTRSKWNPWNVARSHEHLRRLMDSYGESEGRLVRSGRHVPPPVLAD